MSELVEALGRVGVLYGGVSSEREISLASGSAVSESLMRLSIENILIDYHKAYNLPVSILRYFNAAGADIKGDIGEDHNPETHLIPLVLEGLFNEHQIFVNKVICTNYAKTLIVTEVDNLSKAGLNILRGSNLNEIGIIPKKVKKIGFFEKLFHIFS